MQEKTGGKKMRKGFLKRLGTLALMLSMVVGTVNIPIIKGNIGMAHATATDTVLQSWDFDDGLQDWYYGGEDWEYQYDGGANSSIEADEGQLKINVDYSGNSDADWSQTAVAVYNNDGWNLQGANRVMFDFYYDTQYMTKGSFKIKIFSNAGIDVNSSIDTEHAEVISGTRKKVKYSIDFDEISSEPVQDWAINVIGNETDYKGSVWIDNVKIISNIEEGEDIYVNSTVVPVTGSAIQPLIIDNGKLVIPTNAGSENIELVTEISLVDKDADNNTKQLYSYLEGIGRSSSAIFGQQNNTHHKAGSNKLSSSDTYDIVNSYAGVIGIDTLSLTGDEYSASRFNSELGIELGAEQIPETFAGNVEAAAALTNYNIKQGGIITLSAHMPNFSIVKETGVDDGIHSYSKYDFSGYSPGNLTGDVMNQILPGGQYHTVYTAYLDMIADYANQVNGSILFRPFHENTGSWFWWGAAFCNSETYKNVYRYTVEYLRDIKDIHNLIYVYGPGSEAASVEEYGVRYPGDEYVDMVGFDMYHADPSPTDSWFTNFTNQIEVVETFAKEHGKLFAVTETGVASSTPDRGDSQTALHKTGNSQPEWYQRIQSIVKDSAASYFLVWANFSKTDGFYTPYVQSIHEDGSLYGHEMLDKFIEYYNDPTSIFAVDQQDAFIALSSLEVQGNAITDQATGYLTSPIAGFRITDEIIISSRITGASESDIVKFVLSGEIDVELVGMKGSDGVTYTASLNKNTLETLGESIGTIGVYIQDRLLNQIQITFNIPEPEEDPYQIDGFENYYGVNSLLTGKWATNKATGSNITISLTNVKDTYYSGEYGMQFTYDETDDGWAGATIAKEVDWSTCNALSFYTIPDGKNQKIVVQITANGIVYEVYLNSYEGYRDSTSPMLVTIPFEAFCQRDTPGNPKGGLSADASKVTSFGLWVNAIAESAAVVNGRVSGTIYYDDITAVSTTKADVEFKVLDAGGSSGGNSGGGSQGSQNSATEKPQEEKVPKVTTTLKIEVSTSSNYENKKLNAAIQKALSKEKEIVYIVLDTLEEIDKQERVKVNVEMFRKSEELQKVYVYAYNEETGKIERLNKTQYTVSKKGNVDIVMERKTTYLIFPYELDGSMVVTRVEQTKVLSSKNVGVGKKVTLTPTIYPEFREAKVAYRTSNSKVATISKKGILQGKSKGKVTIYTDVAFGKSKKTFKTTVTVK